MSNDNTLDDLILTDPEPEKAKSKGLLALLALVILLIIVGAILAKMIFSDQEESAKRKDNQKVEVASDINTNLDSATATNEKKDTNDGLEPIAADPDLTPISDNANDMPSNIDTINVDEDKKANTKAKSEVKESTQELKGDSTKVAVAEDDLGVAPVRAKASRKTVEDTPKRATVKEKQPRHTKPKERVKKHSIGGRGSVYIQVGSFAKGPESSFIRKIRRAGFKYRIRTQNGLRRVFVGPFQSREEASRYLGRVRSEISSQAFIK